MSKNESVKKLTLAAMFAALAFICFSYLRIEIPMGGGMTGKIYIGHAFILLSSFLLGARYGGLTGAIGLSLADILAGYVVSAPPTFVAKFLMGLAAAVMARQAFHLERAAGKKKLYVLTGIAGFAACAVNVVTEPVIRYAFKVYIMGYPEQLAYLSSVNCAVSMAVSAVPSIFLAAFLYVSFRAVILHNLEEAGSSEESKPRATV